MILFIDSLSIQINFSILILLTRGDYMKKNSKINRIRGWALALVFIGMIIMYIGVFFRQYPIVFSIFLIIGFFPIILSFIVYFWIGMLSTKTIQVKCPHCEHYTKMLGRADICSNCNEAITIDPELDGKEFNEDYNNRRKREKLLQEDENKIN